MNQVEQQRLAGSETKPAATGQSILPAKRALNGQAVLLTDIPNLRIESFRQSLIQAPSQHRRVAAFFGVGEPDGVRLYAVLAGAGEGQLFVMS